MILTYVLKTFWWRNVGLKILTQCDIKFDQQILKYIYVGQWPIFCGTVIRPYIFNTIWWTSLILWILVLIWATDLYFMIKRFWFIYLFLPIVVCWSLIWKYLWIQQVRNRPVVYSRQEVGASVNFKHISSFHTAFKTKCLCNCSYPNFT